MLRHIASRTMCSGRSTVSKETNTALTNTFSELAANANKVVTEVTKNIKASEKLLESGIKMYNYGTVLKSTIATLGTCFVAYNVTSAIVTYNIQLDLQRDYELHSLKERISELKQKTGTKFASD